MEKERDKDGGWGFFEGGKGFENIYFLLKLNENKINKSSEWLYLKYIWYKNMLILLSMII